MSAFFRCDRCSASCAAEGGDDEPKLPRTWQRLAMPWADDAGTVRGNARKKTLCTACTAGLAAWVKPTRPKS